MKKLSLVLICLAFWGTGCSTGYRVYINGYSEQAEAIKPNAALYVDANDTTSRNPVFDNQIKAKIETLLRLNNYVPVPDINEAEYVITFRVGVSSHEYHYYEPFYHTYFGFHSGYRHGGYGFGYTTFVPYYDTYYDRWLSMTVSQRGGTAGTSSEKVIWVGDAVISTNGEDLRRVIDYLIVGCFDYFGIDTIRRKSIIVSENDPKILDIQNIR